MAIKRTTADGHFSDCVRIRVNYTCEFCKIEMEHEKIKSQCAHIISRKHKSIRHDPNNAVCLCASCHSKFTDDPYLFGRWLFEYIGDGMMVLLREKAHHIKKKYPNEEKEKSKHYLEEKKRMLKLREQGETGRIEFVGFY